MILTHASGTERLTSDAAKRLREADEVSRFHESGWACAAGFKSNRMTVCVHANSDAEIDDALGITPEREKYGYRYR